MVKKMKPSSRLAGQGVAIALVTMLLASCAHVSVPVPGHKTQPQDRQETKAPERQPELAAFRANLSGRHTVPASGSQAQGQLLAVLNRDTGLLRWKLRYATLSGPVTGGAFHSPGMDGEVAPVTLSMGRSVLSPSEGRAILKPAQRASLLAGQWYVNLPTARYPQGELRGQLIERN